MPAATACNVTHNLRQLFWWTIALCMGASLSGPLIVWEVYAHGGPVLDISGTVILVSVGLFVVSAFVGPYLLGKTHALRDPLTAADARALAAKEKVPGTKVLVQTVSRRVTAPNAEAVGFGPTRRVVLWDTLLDGRFDRVDESVRLHALRELRDTLDGYRRQRCRSRPSGHALHP